MLTELIIFTLGIISGYIISQLNEIRRAVEE